MAVVRSPRSWGPLGRKRNLFQKRNTIFPGRHGADFIENSNILYQALGKETSNCNIKGAVLGMRKLAHKTVVRLCCHDGSCLLSDHLLLLSMPSRGFDASSSIPLLIFSWVGVLHFWGVEES